mgnify:FL=1|tara:strand:+ start:383 stop:511 length:129 start_codon:yes stop_codon:yes gene_type:complete
MKLSVGLLKQLIKEEISKTDVAKAKKELKKDVEDTMDDLEHQ